MTADDLDPVIPTQDEALDEYERILIEQIQAIHAAYRKQADPLVWKLAEIRNLRRPKIVFYEDNLALIGN